MSAVKRVYNTILVLAFSALLSASANADRIIGSSRQDSRAWDKGDTVRFYLNWETFEKAGFPREWENILPILLSNAISRWEQIGGMDLNLTYSGLTTETIFSESENKVLVRGLKADYPGGRSGSYAHANGVLILFKGFYNGDLKDANYVDRNWVLSKPSSDDQYSLYSVLLHEIGHTLGLADRSDEPTSDLRSIMGNSSQLDDKELRRHGPFIEDIKTLRSPEMYGTRQGLKTYLMRSTNDGESWSHLSPGIPAVSTMPFVVNRDNDAMTIFFTDYRNYPSWLFGSSNATSFNRRPVSFGGNTASIYGTSGHGYDGELMMAWVDPYQSHQIVLQHSSNGGATFQDIPIANAYAAGTVGIRKISDDTWVLAYPKLDLNNYRNSGTVVARVSHDDGRNWSNEKVVKDNYIALSGVTMADKGADDIRIGFSYLSNDEDKFLGLRTLKTHIDGDQLKWDKTISNNSTIANTDYSFTSSDDYFFVGRRTTGADINVGRSAETANSWGNFVYLDDDRNPLVGPGCTARKTSNYVYCFYVDD